MRIYCYITMSRKMFGAGHHTIILHTFHVLYAKRGHFVFIFSKTTVVNYRVIGIIIYIHNGCKICLYANTLTLVGNNFPITVSNRRILHGTQHHLSGEWEYAICHTHTYAPLGINSYQQRCFCNGL